jgi:hypothetical protein
MLDKMSIKLLNGIIATPITLTARNGVVFYTRELVVSDEEGEVFIISLQSQDVEGLIIEDQHIE